MMLESDWLKGRLPLGPATSSEEKREMFDITNQNDPEDDNLEDYWGEEEDDEEYDDWGPLTDEDWSYIDDDWEASIIEWDPYGYIW